MSQSPTAITELCYAALTHAAALKMSAELLDARDPDAAPLARRESERWLKLGQDALAEHVRMCAARNTVAAARAAS